MPTKNWLEWTVFGVSLLLVLAVLGYLGYDAATMGDAPPMLMVELGEAVEQPGGFAVPVTVMNGGDDTAEDVEVEVTLSRNGNEIEQSQFSIAFVPRGSQGDGWVMFREDPAGGELTAKVLGYEQP